MLGLGVCKVDLDLGHQQCRNADVKLKLKKARQALRSQSERMSSDGLNADERAKLQKATRNSIDQAKLALKAQFNNVNAPDYKPAAERNGEF